MLPVEALNRPDFDDTAEPKTSLGRIAANHFRLTRQPELTAGGACLNLSSIELSRALLLAHLRNEVQTTRCKNRLHSVLNIKLT